MHEAKETYRAGTVSAGHVWIRQAAGHEHPMTTSAEVP